MLYAIPETLDRLNRPGLQQVVATRLGITRRRVNYIWTCQKRATLYQAAELEDLFTRLNIPLTRWDLLYGFEVGENMPSLSDYTEKKMRDWNDANQ